MTMRRFLLGIALSCAVTGIGLAQELAHGQLRVTRAAKGKIDLNSGQAIFTIRNWEMLLAAESDGVDPANEPFTIGIQEERFVIPAGQLRSKANGKRFLYKAKVERGISQLKLVRTAAGPIRITMKLVGVDLTRLVISDPPACLPFAVIIGDDDGFSGVSFDRPKPYPSKLLTIPGFCDEATEWPWA